MNRFSDMLRRFSMNLNAGMRRFMMGRYGVDRLNMVILGVGLVASLLSAMLRGTWPGFILWGFSYAMMFWAIFRLLSRNTYKRYQENRRFLTLRDRFRDRQNRYFSCPKCHQVVRIPRGKGKVAITCPKCREKFIKKT